MPPTRRRAKPKRFVEAETSRIQGGASPSLPNQENQNASVTDVEINQALELQAPEVLDSATPSQSIHDIGMYVPFATRQKIILGQYVDLILLLPPKHGSYEKKQFRRNSH